MRKSMVVLTTSPHAINLRRAVIIAKVGSNVDCLWELLECGEIDSLVDKTSRMQEVLDGVVGRSGLMLMPPSRFQLFGNHSYTYIAVLSESHFAIHTWPEEHKAVLNLHFCNFSQNNCNKAKILLGLCVDIFGARRIKKHLDRIL